jgi:hypothetical protein
MLPRDMIGCVFRAGCVSNRGRQHFELNRVTPRVTEGHDRVCVPSQLCFKLWETTL